MLREALAIRDEDAASCHRIGVYALSLLRPGMGILTHCNAGHLAVSEYGTALAPVYLGQQQGYNFKVYADETRPLLQGARLTAFELFEDGIPVTLITDNMAAWTMRTKGVNAVVVGADRIAANGDTANKIGTYGVALAAKAHGIPFYIAAPTSTFDFSIATGAQIPIEERKADEVRHFRSEQTAPEGVAVFNPAFDVTPAELITGIITEHGVLKAPYTESIKKLQALLQD